MTKKLFAKAATVLMVLAASLLGMGSAYAQNRTGSAAIAINENLTRNPGY